MFVVFLVTALYAELNYDCDKAVMDTNETVTVYQKRLVERALKLCDILRYEFILYRPCQELVDIILDTIQKLLHMGVLNQDEVCYCGRLNRSHRNYKIIKKHF